MKSKGLWIFLGSLMLLAILAFFALIFAVIFYSSEPQELHGRGDIAVIKIEGTILDSTETLEQLHEVEKNDHVKAVILRIDSPGGAVAPSQEIHQAVLRTRKTKKIIVSMGSVAASGGYYIAAAADKIIANPGTITGSIGVLMEYANVEGLLGFLKIHAETLTAGKRKDIGSPLREMSPEERAYLHEILDNMHEQFKTAVREGRHFDQEKIDELADGRVFTGEQALKVGLVDQLGNQQTAVDVAKEMLGLPKDKDPVLLFPRKKKTNVLDLLADGDLQNKAIQLFDKLREGRALYLSRGVIHE